MNQNKRKVFVSTVENPGEFYVRFVDLHEKFAQLEKHFQRSMQASAEIPEVPVKVSLNHLYLTKNTQDQQCYRVQAKEILSDDRIKVFFVDYGKTKILLKSQLRRCNLLLKIVGKALKCSLFISEGKNQMFDNPEVNFLFKCLVGKKQTFELVVRNVTVKTLFVDLVTQDRVHNFSVADVLLSVMGITKTPSVTMNIKAMPIVQINGKTAVKITQVNSPSDFYVTLISMEQDEVVMHTEMTEFHQQKRAFFTLLVPGDMCTFQDVCGLWNRVEVLAAPGKDGLTKVRLVDSGEVISLAWSELFELDQQFYNIPKYALPCSLAGIEPFDTEWTARALEFFKHCLALNDKQIEIYTCADGVELSILYDGIEININELLVHMQFAKPTNKASRDFVKIVEIDKPANEKLHNIEIVSPNFIPSKFRVKFLGYSGAIDKMSESIEKQLVEENCTWIKGDSCIVPYKVDEAKGTKWHRGRIIDIKKGTAEGIKAVVALIDHGSLVEIWIQTLRRCPREFVDIEDTVKFVRLACIKRSWNETEVEKIQSVMKSFNIFHITFKDNNNILFANSSEPRPVILWGSVPGGAKHNIISELEANGLVESIYQERLLLPKDRKDWTLKDFIKEAVVLEATLACPKKEVYPLDGRTIDVENYAVTMKKQMILDWLPAVAPMKTMFTGLATSIDRAGNIVLHDVSDNRLFDIMEKIINDNFKRPSKKHQFKIGEPCLVNFENDGLYYRGKVLTLDGEDCEVEFIDYGNIQKSKTRHLSRYVICSEIPPLAQRYRLKGSPITKNGVIDQHILNILHAIIVDKNIKVQVIPDDYDVDDPNYIKRCWITFDGHEIRNYNGILDIIDESPDKISR